MKKYLFFVLTFFCFSTFASSNFDELGKNPKALSELGFSGSSLAVVQKRWLPKRFLSELSVGISPILKGFNYTNSFSTDVSYRFFLNNSWSFQLKYLWYFNPANQEGKDEVQKRARIPLELKYPQKQSYLGGIEWYPFYGKAVLYNRLVRFDLYVSALGGVVELINFNQKVPTGSLALGLVNWWHKRVNTRLEFQGSYYNYDAVDEENISKNIEKYFYKIYVSTGVLF